jgi:8-oxo-dGTP diphosphatase
VQPWVDFYYLTIDLELLNLNMKMASIGIIKNDKNEILVGKRIPSLIYGTPGGKIEDGETPEEAVIRELLEETDLVITKCQQRCVLDTADGWRVYVFDIIEVKNSIYKIIMQHHGEIKNMEPEKCEKWEWIKESEIKKLKTIYALEMIYQ